MSMLAMNGMWRAARSAGRTVLASTTAAAAAAGRAGRSPAQAALAPVGAVRTLSASATMRSPELTVEMAADIQATHTANLKNEFMMYAKQLAQIKERTEDPFHKRWQDTMQVFMSSQLHTLLLYGYTPDETGMRDFNMAFDQLCRSDGSGRLLQSVRERHLVLVSRAFGVDIEDEELPLEQARHMSSLIAMKMQSEDFLKKIDQALDGVQDTQAKQEAIMATVLPLQMEVAEGFGFKGDNGYLRMQCLMMQHSSDEQISYNTLSGLMPVYRRAGISLGPEQQQQQQQQQQQ